jgi:CAAX prenyl protease-like protein
VSAILWHFRDVYRSWVSRFSWTAVIFGLVTFVIWLLLVTPNDEAGVTLTTELKALPTWAAMTWIVFRVIGSVVIVPIAEELAFRGYLFSKLNCNRVPGKLPARFHWLSFLGSSLAFGLLHSNWIAGTVAGMAYALALIHRGRIMDAVTAHVTTNLLITLNVIAFEQWAFWT